jgi:V/A-type H+-transporting ATPase subunit D
LAEVKLTKNELRTQQTQLSQLNKYLPTLQLKKAMLQVEVNDARLEIIQLQAELSEAHGRVTGYQKLLAEKTGIDPKSLVVVETLRKRYENIAGVDVPYYEGVDFQNVSYDLFETPSWLDGATLHLRTMVASQLKVLVVEEKKAALERELREVSIRVNLFEKILIPRCQGNIKKIKVFLGDQQLAAVCQAKVAKSKIEAKKALMEAVHA